MIALDTIKSTREIDAIFRTGARVSTPLFMLLTTETPHGRDPSGRVAFIAGKKLGNAPFRSRCKRVLRETVRRIDPSWPGRDMVFVARHAAATATPSQLERALDQAIRKIGRDR